jgi:hypothetical protein
MDAIHMRDTSRRVNRHTAPRPSQARLEYRKRRIKHFIAQGGDEAIFALITTIADRFGLDDPVDRLLDGGR